MNLSLAQANQQLNALLANGGKPTVQQLVNLASNVRVTVPNATTTLLYAGTVNGAPNYQVAGKIGSQNPQIAILDKTDAYDFVREGGSFYQALDAASAREGININAVYQGKMPDGKTRISDPSHPWYGNGVFDRISENFAANAVGDVRVIVPNASAQSVFNLSELPTLLANPKVTSIEGILRSELLNGSLQQAFRKVEIASSANYSLLQLETVIVVDSNGVAQVNVTDVGERVFFNTHPTAIGNDLVPSADVHIGADALSDDPRLSGLLDNADGLFSVSTLNKIGIAGAVIAAGITMLNAGEAWAAGDEIGAQNIVEEFLYDTAAGELGAAGALMALAGGLALAGVSLPAGMIGVILVVAVSIAGDMAGSELIDTKEILSSIVHIVEQLADGDFSQLITDFANNFTTLLNSPIVVDLQNDGLSLVGRANATNNVFFDIEGKGFAKDVGWIKNTEAFLVRDTNNNGVIDNVKEMFGDNNGTSAFAKLKLLDANNDNALTNNEIATLRLWVDSDSDGATDAGELRTLASQNIARIDVTKQAFTATSFGNKVDGFVNIRNSTGTVISKGYDVFFDTDGVNSWFVGDSLTTRPTINPEALLRPLSRGYGDVKSLHYALTDNPALMAKMDTITALNRATQMTTIDKHISEFLTLWAGKTGITATSANVGGINGINGQTFEVVQAFAGQDYVRNGTGSLIPDLDGSLYHHRAYSALAQHVKEVILVQSVLKDVFPNAFYSFSQGDMVLQDSLTAILNRAVALRPTDSVQNQAYWGHIAGIIRSNAAEFGITESAALSAVSARAGFTPNTYSSYVLGTSSVDNFRGSGEAEFLDMLAGNDTVRGDWGNDMIQGGDGNDVLNGEVGADNLRGGLGTDSLVGGLDNDTYVYVRGDGHDTIFDTGRATDSDSISITNHASSVAVFTRVANSSDFMITFTGTATDSILVRQGLEGGSDTLEQVIFASGGSRTIAQIRSCPSPSGWVSS